MKKLVVCIALVCSLVTSAAADIHHIMPAEELEIPASAIDGIIMGGERVKLNGETYLYMYTEGVHVGYAITGDVFWVRFEADADVRPPFDVVVRSDNKKIFPPGKIFSVIPYADAPTVFRVYNPMTVSNEENYAAIVEHVQFLQKDMNNREESVTNQYISTLSLLGVLCNFTAEAKNDYGKMSLDQRQEVLDIILSLAQECR